MSVKTFQINGESVDLLKQLMEERKLQDGIFTLDALIKYAIEKFEILSLKLESSYLTNEQKNDIRKKILIAERKFRHMLDVPMLCIKRIDKEQYSNEQALLLMIIGILHDIGRIDEIISQTVQTMFKMKVDHSFIGANFLVANDKLSNDDRIFDFVDDSLVFKHWQLIKNCVRYHGTDIVPSQLFSTDLEKSLIRDIRLIDKSSIMNSFLYEDMQSVIGITLEQLASTHISDATFMELTNENFVDRKKPGEEYTPNRHFMSHVGFIYDMDDYSMLDDDWVTKYLEMYQPVEEKDQIRKDAIRKCAVRRLCKYGF